jgi:hypothetical protein
MTARSIEDRVAGAAEAALADKKFVTPVDVLMGVGWLQPGLVDRWRQGRVEYLEAAAQVDSPKLSHAMTAFRRWSEQRGLQPSETEYVARTRDRRRLRFTPTGDAAAERAYSTHWVSPELSERRRERLRERQSRPPDLVVISPIRDWACAECGGSGDLLMMEAAGPLCLECVDMEHLVFLPSGDAALTRRGKRASRLSAVVVRFSRARRRYERQGILVEVSALERAEAECLRTRRRAGVGGCATRRGASTRIGTSRPSWCARSRGCSRAVPRTGRRRSPGTPGCEEAAGWGGHGPRERWTRRPSRSRWSRPCATRTRATTSC